MGFECRHQLADSTAFDWQSTVGHEIASRPLPGGVGPPFGDQLEDVPGATREWYLLEEGLHGSVVVCRILGGPTESGSEFTNSDREVIDVFGSESTADPSGPDHANVTPTCKFGDVVDQFLSGLGPDLGGI